MSTVTPTSLGRVIAAGVVFVGLSVVIAIRMLPRYDIRVANQGRKPILLRIDRWTGQTQSCLPLDNDTCFAPPIDQRRAADSEAGTSHLTREQCEAESREAHGVSLDCLDLAGQSGNTK